MTFSYAVDASDIASDILSLSPATTTAASLSRAMSSTQFTPGDRVLCYHGPLFYEAKVLKVSGASDPSATGQPGPHYRVHYKGWKSMCVIPSGSTMKRELIKFSMFWIIDRTDGSSHSD